MKRFILLSSLLFLVALPEANAGEDSAQVQNPLLKAMSEELDYSMKNLAMPDGKTPYFISYTINDLKNLSINAWLGAVKQDDISHSRLLDVDIRVGDYRLDNTHKIRESGFSFGGFSIGGGFSSISLDDNPSAIKQAIWLATDRSFKEAAKKYQRVLTNLKTKVDEEDPSPDFSHEKMHCYSEPDAKFNLDRAEWAERLRKISRLAKKYPLIYNSSVSLSAKAVNRYLVNSEGSSIKEGARLFRVVVNASTKAEDGMDLSQGYIFNASSEEKLPKDEEIMEAFEKVLKQVVALRDAPIVEPYTGPAILMNRASGVFFHEIFGHRIEGHRQKDVDEGQTFTKKVGEAILPEFLSVLDDPTLTQFGGEDLRGYYKYDDEGVPAQKVTLVNKGILENFLMCRSPIKGYPVSNGHGRKEPGNTVVSRMGNTIISSSKSVPFNELRNQLIDECKKQKKPYGLLFQDISGGFTGTQRGGAQVFKVLPLVVYKVFPNGKPDELVRGVDIVGTPLTCFSKIIATGDDPAVFNGTCGAESGSVPVSAVSPSILVSQMEVEKQSRDQAKPPILTPPISDTKDGAN